jgi:phage shock protein A
MNSHETALAKDLDQTRDTLARDIAEYQSIHDKYAQARKDSTAYAGRAQSTLHQSVVEHSYFVLWGTIAALATLGAAYFFRKPSES